ncbi:MAG: hypothetical protein QM699_10035 [Amaricoccus sp.]|uniref:hypothetical protein n=1 Tax=Amaricoccus sp. TaxID=1872485 RepID=UPI0039E69C85
MEREIDLSARHLMDWLRSAPPGIEARATREFLCEGAPVATAGVDAEDELEVATTVGLVEVRPLREAGEAWVLRLRVENPLACHLPDDGSVPDDPEEIGLDEFEACFLEDEAGDAAVTVEADRAACARAFDEVLAGILRAGQGAT